MLKFILGLKVLWLLFFNKIFDILLLPLKKLKKIVLKSHVTSYKKLLSEKANYKFLTL